MTTQPKETNPRAEIIEDAKRLLDALDGEDHLAVAGKGREGFIKGRKLRLVQEFVRRAEDAAYERGTCTGYKLGLIHGQTPGEHVEKGQSQ